MKPKPSFSPEELRNIEGRVVALTQLQKSDGWKLYSAMLDSTALAAEAAAYAARESLEMAKHLGAMRTAKDLQSWVEREIKYGTLALEESK